MRGQSSVEYLLVAALFAVALVLGADEPLARLTDALGAYLRHYTFTLSRP